MKPWKIITVAFFAVVAVALVTGTALAYMGTQATYRPYSPNGFTEARNGGMRCGAGWGPYSSYNGYKNSTVYPQQYGQHMGGCGPCYP